MLYVIGGTPRAGKSILARRMITSRSISAFPVDALIEAFKAVAPELGIDYEHPDREDRFYPALRASLRQILQCHANYLIEGEVLSPTIARRLTDEFYDVRSCFLVMSRPTVETLLAFEGSNPWLARQTPQWQKTFVDAVSERSARLVDDCAEYGYPCIDMSIGDFGQRLREAENWLAGRGLGPEQAGLGQID